LKFPGRVKGGRRERRRAENFALSLPLLLLLLAVVVVLGSLPRWISLFFLVALPPGGWELSLFKRRLSHACAFPTPNSFSHSSPVSTESET